MIAIIDYGLGNLGSIYNIIKKIGNTDVKFASNATDISSADKYILPGVGAYDTGMNMLNASGMREELDRQVLENGKPILGICLGMQMLGNSSEEGEEPGLGYIPFRCRKFDVTGTGLRVPHMGWDFVNITKDSELVAETRENLRFYFVHSYYAECKNEQDVLMTCSYGKDFVAAVAHDNIYGVQFHPEKSHRYGKWLLKNFIERVGNV